MDDSVLAQFESSFLISSEVNDPQRIYPHYYSYKSKKKVYTSQEERRAKFLEEQLSRRRNFADHARKIAEGGELSEVEEDDGDVEETIADQVNTVCNGGDSVQVRGDYDNTLPLTSSLVDQSSFALLKVLVTPNFCLSWNETITSQVVKSLMTSWADGV